MRQETKVMLAIIYLTIEYGTIALGLVGGFVEIFSGDITKALLCVALSVFIKLFFDDNKQDFYTLLDEFTWDEDLDDDEVE